MFSLLVNLFLAQPSDPTEIINIVNHFKSNKSAGWDDIHPSVITNVIPFIAQPLSKIVNLSLSSGTFPDQLKIAKVLPIFKNDDKKLINNSRPISVLPVFQKSLKKLCLYDLSVTWTRKNYLFLNCIRNTFHYTFMPRYHKTSSAMMCQIH